MNECRAFKTYYFVNLSICNSLHAGRSVSRLDTDINIDQLLPAALLQLIQLQSGIDFIVSMKLGEMIAEIMFQFPDDVSRK